MAEDSRKRWAILLDELLEMAEESGQRTATEKKEDPEETLLGEQEDSHQ